jgi:hypothetical protein
MPGKVLLSLRFFSICSWKRGNASAFILCLRSTYFFQELASSADQHGNLTPVTIQLALIVTIQSAFNRISCRVESLSRERLHVSLQSTAVLSFTAGVLTQARWYYLCNYLCLVVGSRLRHTWERVSGVIWFPVFCSVSGNVIQTFLDLLRQFVLAKVCLLELLGSANKLCV